MKESKFWKKYILFDAAYGGGIIFDMGKVVLFLLALTIIPVFIYWSVRIDTPTKYISFETAMAESIESGEAFEKIVFVNEDNYGTYKGAMVTQTPVSFWQFLTPDEQEETLQRAYATDAHYLGMIYKADEIVSKYEKYIKKPERALNDSELAAQIQKDCAVLNQMIDENLHDFDRCDPKERQISIWPDGVCIGDYLSFYRRNEWTPGGKTSLDDEKDYYIYTYQYGQCADLYVTAAAGVLYGLHGEATGHGQNEKMNKSTDFRLDYNEFTDALEAVCSARAYMYVQMQIDPADVTDEYLQLHGFPVQRSAE